MLGPEMLILFFKVYYFNCNNGLCKQHKSKAYLLELEYGLKIIYVEPKQ